MKWIPNPLDLSEIDLGEKGTTLLEQVAENVHAVWGKERYETGWRYGPERDDAKKETPCMVPYQMLPEAEKEIDRRAAEQAIKAAIKIGLVKLAEE